MLELFGLAETFYNTLLSIGDLLVATPLSDFLSFRSTPSYTDGLTLWLAYRLYEYMGWDTSHIGKSWLELLGISEYLDNLSLAFLVFGAGLSFIIVFKVIKFFTDLFA